MKRPRPYIPVPVRVQVAQRQLNELVLPVPRLTGERDGSYLGRLLNILKAAMRAERLQLDHDPALILRTYNEVANYYYPDANDPDHLIYREHEDHQQKTTGRKIGATKTVTTKGSDIWLKSKFNRLEGRTKKKRKQKIQSRPFTKQKRRFK